MSLPSVVKNISNEEMLECAEEFYRVKEDLIFKNFLEKSRSDKAKVLRLQQLKNYRERQHSGLDNTISRVRKQTDVVRNVRFAPSSLIQDAIKEGNKYEVLDFLSTGIPINFNDAQGEGMTLLHQACVYDDYIIAQALIKKGASVNKEDDYGCTPIHICCLWDSIKCAQLLMSSNASTSVLDNDSNFAVDLASENSHLRSMMKKHMQQKLKIDDSQLQSLRNKTQKSMLQDIRQLLEEGNSVDLQSTAGISLLHIAVTNGYVSAARMLLENSANVNSADLQMWTPLHCAAKYGQVKMTRLLLSHYANPHAHTTSGFTPRELAKDPEIITMLSNAEDTFLDLDKQKTPAKTKRFSASLLDQCEDGEEVSRVQSRTISSTKISKRDVLKEKEFFHKLEEDLRQDLKLEMQFKPPDANTSTPALPVWHQLMPPPVPPRDDPPEIQSPLQTPQKTKQKNVPTNQLHDEKLLKAVITIQRAVRRYFKLDRQHCPLEIALETIENYGNSFYDEMVIQNAEDIARESDRQRARKSQLRNSWSNDRRRNARSYANARPLSTGTLLPMQMPNAPDDNAIWLPQNPMQMHNPYHRLPPDVVPHYSESKDYWNTMPRSMGSQQRRSLKGLSAGSIDSGVSLTSDNKDYIELAGTVKRSLTISENTKLQPMAPATLMRKGSLPVYHPPNHSTYKMPPLTPTVATLINTATYKKNQRLPKSVAKVMKPVAAFPTNDETVYSSIDGPPTTNANHYHSMRNSMKEHRYGTLLSNRGSILLDARMKNLNNPDSTLPNRHSWSFENQEGSTNFGSGGVPPPTHPIISPPPSYETRQFADGLQNSIESIPNSISSSSISSSGRRNSKPSEGLPPPPPRRAPSTRLSGSSENVKAPSNRKGSLSTFSSSPTSEQTRRTPPNLTLPLMKNQNSGLNLGAHDNSPDDDLPVIPPPLPLYTPQALAPKNDPNSMDLPAPPPPDVLLYDTLKNMGSLQRKPQPSDGYLDFPPPPPTL